MTDTNYDLHYDVGEDGGNGYQKTSINDDVFIYPSQILEVLDSDRTDETSKIDSKDLGAVKSFFGSDEEIKKQMAVTLKSEGLMNHNKKGASFLVGDFARSTFDTIEAYDVETKTRKSESDISFVSTLSLIAYCSVRDFVKTYNALPQTTLNVRVNRFVTALPLNEFKRPGVSNLFESRFRKYVHTVTINNFDEPLTVNISFNYVNVMPEGFPAILALIYDPKNPLLARNDDLFDHVYFDPNTYRDQSELPRIDGDSLQHKNILEIDIGDGSTDCNIIQDFKSRLALSSGIEEGIGTCAQKAINKLNESNPNNVRTTRQKFLAKAMTGHSYGAKMYRQALEDRLPLFFKNLDEKVVRTISQFKDEIDFVVVSGGGSVFLEKYHLREFQEAVRKASGFDVPPILVVPAKYSQLLNLSGIMVFLYRLRKANIGND